MGTNEKMTLSIEDCAFEMFRVMLLFTSVERDAKPISFDLIWLIRSKTRNENTLEEIAHI